LRFPFPTASFFDFFFADTTISKADYLAFSFAAVVKAVSAITIGKSVTLPLVIDFSVVFHCVLLTSPSFLGQHGLPF
jgi:hypothetical protein